MRFPAVALVLGALAFGSGAADAALLSHARVAAEQLADLSVMQGLTADAAVDIAAAAEQTQSQQLADQMQAQAESRARGEMQEQIMQALQMQGAQSQQLDSSQLQEQQQLNGAQMQQQLEQQLLQQAQQELRFGSRSTVDARVAGLESQLNSAFQQVLAGHERGRAQQLQLAQAEQAAEAELSAIGANTAARGAAELSTTGSQSQGDRQTQAQALGDGSGSGVPGYFGNAYPYAAGYPMFGYGMGMGMGGPLYRGGVMGGYGMGMGGGYGPAAGLGMGIRPYPYSMMTVPAGPMTGGVGAVGMASYAAGGMGYGGVGLGLRGGVGMGGGMAYGSPYVGPLYANALYPGTVQNPFLPPPPFGLGMSNVGLGYPVASGLRYSTYPVQIVVARGGTSSSSSASGRTAAAKVDSGGPSVSSTGGGGGSGGGGGAGEAAASGGGGAGAAGGQ
jgi:hypothetical protein